MFHQSSIDTLVCVYEHLRAYIEYSSADLLCASQMNKHRSITDAGQVSRLPRDKLNCWDQTQSSPFFQSFLSADCSMYAAGLDIKNDQGLEESLPNIVQFRLLNGSIEST